MLKVYGIGLLYGDVHVACLPIVVAICTHLYVEHSRRQLSVLYYIVPL